MNIEVKITKRIMDIPVRRVADLQRIGKIPMDAIITINGNMAHVEFELKQ